MLVLPVAATSGALVVGASKVVSLESPELSVQRVYVPESVDVFRFGGGAMAAIDFVATGWLRWAASIAARHTNELDLWVNPTAPHSLCARPRHHAAARRSPPSSARRGRPERRVPDHGRHGRRRRRAGRVAPLRAGRAAAQHRLISRRVDPVHPTTRASVQHADISSADSLRGSADAHRAAERRAASSTWRACSTTDCSPT